MAHPYHHALRSAKLFGGLAEDYLAIHSWFDESKSHMPDLRHRALRHHSEGIFLCESIFGVTLTNSSGKNVPTRLIGEQHVKDDLGWIPTVKDWLQNLKIEPWMSRTVFRPSRDGVEHGPTVLPPAEPDGHEAKENSTREPESLTKPQRP